MASLKNIYEISKANYNTLVEDGTVGDYSFESRSLYLITPRRNMSSDNDIVNIDVNSSSFSQYSGLPSGQSTWFVEGWNDVNYGTVNFGIVNLDSTANTSSSYPLVILGANTTSTTLTTGINVRIEMYYSGTWYIRVSTGNSSYSSFTGVNTYNLTFRRVYI